MPMTPWNASIAGELNNVLVNQEPNNGGQRNWLHFFFYQGIDENSKTNNFQYYFYHPDQIKKQRRRGANFESLRKIAFKILTIAPNLAVNSPGNGEEPALVLGKSRQRFQAPKISIIWNPNGYEDGGNFYVLIDIGDEAWIQAGPVQNSYNDYLDRKTQNPIGKLILKPIAVNGGNQNGPIFFDQDEDQAVANFFRSVLTNLNDKVINDTDNLVYCLNNARPDGIPVASPIYPKLIETFNPRKRSNNGEEPPPEGPEGNFQEQLIMNQNTILFGPPGTGKTYNTVSAAIFALRQTNDMDELIRSSYKNMVGGQFFETTFEERNELKNEFDYLEKKGRIIFTTFHQSYAYEDFIEGIRVRTEDGKICYEIQNGTFKQLARKALFFKASGKSDDEINDSLEKASNFYASTLDEELKKWISDESSKDDHGSDEKELIRQLINNDSSILNFINEKSDEYTPKFVLIIDEINRGNISKILGELITLIEDSKRAGGGETVTVKLPSSRENFKVPDNLYIIGTMNTSDRSLATLDIALRRRFDFIEMMPQKDFLNGIKIDEIELKKWFAELNQKIQLARGREFTIGHAFFAPLKEKETAPTIHDLANIMQRKILPLLDEYFFEDWEGIRRVLADSESNVPHDFVHKKKFGNETLYYWNTQALTNPQAYKKLYEKNNVQGVQAPVEQ